MIEVVLDAIQAGSSIRDAAGAAGVHHNTVYRWIAAGERGEQPFAAFLAELKTTWWGQSGEEDRGSGRVEPQPVGPTASPSCSARVPPEASVSPGTPAPDSPREHRLRQTIAALTAMLADIEASIARRERDAAAVRRVIRLFEQLD